MFLLLFLASICCQEAKDGKVYKLEFSETRQTISYEYRNIDPMATFTVTFYPTKKNGGEASLSICLSEDCSRAFKTIERRGTYNVPVDTIGVNLTVYLVAESTSSAEYELAVMSSIVLENSKPLSLAPGGYSYEDHENMRYFRTFIDDLEDGYVFLFGIEDSENKGSLYVNSWDNGYSTEPGRPSADNAIVQSQEGNVSLTAGAQQPPNWVFIALDITNVGTNISNVTIEAFTERAKELTEVGVGSNDLLCTYDGCYESVFVDLAKIEGETEVNTVTYLVMSKNKVRHTEAAPFRLFSGDVDPPMNSWSSRTVLDNIISVSSNELSTIRDNGNKVYFSASFANTDEFPSRILTNDTTQINSQVLINMKSLSAEGLLTELKLTRASIYYEETLLASRVVLNLARSRKPYYYNHNDILQPITCNYVVKARLQDETLNAGLKMGAYIGDAKAPMPNAENYCFKSSEPSNDYVSLEINDKDDMYHEDAAYLLDIYSDYDEDSLKVEVVVGASYVLKPGLDYGLDLTGVLGFDYFTIYATDVSKGVSVFAEFQNTFENATTISLYGSMTDKFPDSNAEFVESGKSVVSLYIPSASFKNVNPVDGLYPIYITLDTLHSGTVILSCSEDSSTQYHLVGGHYIDITLTEEDNEAQIHFHSDGAQNARNLIVTFNGIGEWPDNVSLQACLSDTQFKDKGECNQSNGVGLSSHVQSDKLEKTVPASTENRHDYYIYLNGNFRNMKDSSLTIRVFGEYYYEIALKDQMTIPVSYGDEPFLLYLETQQKMDCTIKMTLDTVVGNTSNYDVKICAFFPSISIDDPPDVDPKTEKRNCRSYNLNSLTELKIDLTGDLTDDMKTPTNDAQFIRSIEKYIALYPIAALPSSIISLIAYEDTHVDANTVSQLLWGSNLDVNYFRVHVLSADSTSKNDLFSYKFSGKSVIQYCMSDEDHLPIGSSRCLQGYSVLNADKTEVQNTISLINIDPLYSATNDVYIYFSYYLPNSDQENEITSSTIFSNAIVHYFDIIGGNFQVGGHEFVTTIDSKIFFACYVTDYEINQKMLFVFHPYVDPQTKLENVPSKYVESEVVVKAGTDGKNMFQKPTADDNDIMGGGILIKEYQFSKYENFDVPYAEFSAAFAKISNVLLSYNAFVTERNRPGLINSIAGIEILELNKTYRYSEQSYKLSYYQKANSNTQLRVFPCAGAPAVYGSYIHPFPKHNDPFTYGVPTNLQSYTQGRPYNFEFFEYTGVKLGTPLEIDTGYVFNTTIDFDAYMLASGDKSKLRWDLEMRLHSTEGDVIGPIITNSRIYTHMRGAEMKVVFMEATRRFIEEETRVEYAMFALPVAESPETGFDASPFTQCGLMSYGFPITVDEDDVMWSEGEPSSEDVGVMQSLELFNNLDPNKYKYPSDVVPIRNGPKANTFYVNVVAREVDMDGNVLGYNAYEPVIGTFSGMLPLSQGGLFVWEVVLIALGCVAGVALIVFIVYWVLHKRRLARMYNNFNGSGQMTYRKDDGSSDSLPMLSSDSL